MYPPPHVAAAFWLAYAAAGMAIGIFTGALFSLIAKLGLVELWKDSLLGALGYLAGLIGGLLMPWPRSTIVEPIPGGGTVITTLSRYQHPERIAIAVAILLPLLHQFYRLRGRRAPQ